jgi:hypothetical protein
VAHEDSADYDENGVDLSLIRWFLTLTPEERFAAIDDAVEMQDLLVKRPGHDSPR